MRRDLVVGDRVRRAEGGADDLAVVEAERGALFQGELENGGVVAAMLPDQLDRLRLMQLFWCDGEADLLADLARGGLARALAARDAAAGQRPARPVRAAQ